MVSTRNPLRNNQFARPRGWGGRFVGRVMALGNADMAWRAARRLDLSGSERVLEVGFGPGVGIRALRRPLPRGEVVGIDPSEVMLAQARRRNRRAVRNGRVALGLGSVPGLDIDGPFDAAVSLNNVMLWDGLDAGVRDLARVLRPHGQLLIGVHDWVVPEPRAEYPATLVAALERAGFVEIERWTARDLSGRSFYVVARRGDGRA